MVQLAVLVPALVLTLGGAAIAVQEFGPGGGTLDAAGIDCREALVPSPAAHDGDVLVQLRGREGAGRVRVCLYDEQGVKRADASWDVREGREEAFLLRAPRGEYAIAASVRDEGRYFSGVVDDLDLRSCAARTAEFDVWFRRGDAEIDGGQAGCTQLAPADAASMDMNAADAGPAAPNLGTARSGGGLLLLGGLASLAVFIPLRRRVWFALLPLFTRLQRPRLLDHETRARIHDLVEAEPGIHAAQIAERLELSGSDTLYHLHVLVREAMLVRLRRFTRHHYFLRGRYPPAQMARMVALGNESARRIYQAVLAAPDQTLSGVSRASRVSLSRASKLVKRLCEAGLVERRNDGRAVRLRALGQRP